MDKAITEKTISIDEVQDRFRNEFKDIANKFIIYNLSISEAKVSEAEHVWKPGVYVYWATNKVIKVGRHLTNSRKRALEHIRDNTGGSMHSLQEDPRVRLLLFNLKKKEDLHWAAALEIFFELNLNPEIRAGRLG